MFAAVSGFRVSKSVTRRICSLPIINCGKSGCTAVSSQMSTTCVRLPLLADFFGTNTGKVSFCGVTTPFWSSWFSTMLVSSRFRRSAFCSDAATLANRVRCHCHDVRTWPRRRLGSKKLFFVFTVWGSFPAPFLLTATVLVSILGTFFVPKLRPGGAHKNVFLARFVCEKNNIWPQSNLF